ncbi:MAG: putative glycolipid-binding domain-containing protein [Ilumatobacteraceae bacterium]
MRLSPLWQVRQFLLFRDLAEPDLWLGTDGHGRWGEMNGAHRVDLDGGLDIALAVTPFSHAVPIRRLALAVGQDAPTVVLDVDVETLGVVPSAVSYRRVGEHRYEATRADGTVTIDVDDHGIPTPSTAPSDTLTWPDHGVGDVSSVPTKRLRPRSEVAR